MFPAKIPGTLTVTLHKYKITEGTSTIMSLFHCALYLDTKTQQCKLIHVSIVYIVTKFKSKQRSVQMCESLTMSRTLKHTRLHHHHQINYYCQICSVVVHVGSLFLRSRNISFSVE